MAPKDTKYLVGIGICIFIIAVIIFLVLYANSSNESYKYSKPDGCPTFREESDIGYRIMSRLPYCLKPVGPGLIGSNACCRAKDLFPGEQRYVPQFSDKNKNLLNGGQYHKSNSGYNPCSKIKQNCISNWLLRF